MVDKLKGKSGEEALLALMSDTNFDGANDFVDGGGVRRSLQVKSAYQSAESWLNYEKEKDNAKNGDATTNLIDFIKHLHGTNVFGEGVAINTADGLFNWMKADIRNTKLVQSTLLNSPVDTADIFRYGTGAFKNHSTDVIRQKGIDQKAINDWIETQPDAEKLKNLPPAAKEMLQNSLSAYLAEKMQDVDPKTNLNGLGVGVGIPLNQILQNLTLNLSTGLTDNGPLL